jgi:hypothetical protein
MDAIGDIAFLSDLEESQIKPLGDKQISNSRVSITRNSVTNGMLGDLMSWCCPASLGNG